MHKLGIEKRRLLKMKEDEELLALQNRLKGVRAKIDTECPKSGVIIYAPAKAKRQGELLEKLRQEKREIIRQIQDKKQKKTK